MTDASGHARRWVYWIPAIAMMALIFVLSAQSGLRVSDDVDVDRPFRIVGHLLAFGTLAASLLLALCRGRPPRRRDAAIAFGLTMVYALLDESHQSFVPERSGRLDDVVTDAIGALAGVAAAWIALSWLARRGERRRDASA